MDCDFSLSELSPGNRIKTPLENPLDFECSKSDQNPPERRFAVFMKLMSAIGLTSTMNWFVAYFSESFKEFFFLKSSDMKED